MNNRPLLNAVNEYIRGNPARFHTPGHSGNPSAPPFCIPLAEADLTEIPGLSCLFEEEGVIAESEAAAARLYGAERTLYSAGGSSLAIQTMLALAAPTGSRVIFARNLHVSAVNAAVLLDLLPVFINPEENNIVKPSVLREAFINNPDTSAFYLTSPDYYGRIANIKELAEVCGEFGVPLLLDCAHGAHLPFALPESDPSSSGAAMCAMSAHKTLPALTPAAFLHIYDKKYSRGAKEAMSLFASTSPAYPVMLSLESCCYWLEHHGKSEFARVNRRVCELYNQAAALGFTSETCSQRDPARFTLYGGGPNAAEEFAKHGAVCEYSDENAVVFIITPFHTDSDFEKLSRGIRSLSPHSSPVKISKIGETEIKIPPRQAYFSENISCDTQNSVGKIAARTVYSCPPGVPLIIPGEKISKNSVFLLNHYSVSAVKVLK